MRPNQGKNVSFLFIPLQKATKRSLPSLRQGSINCRLKCTVLSSSTHEHPFVPHKNGGKCPLRVAQKISLVYGRECLCGQHSCCCCCLYGITNLVINDHEMSRQRQFSETLAAATWRKVKYFTDVQVFLFSHKAHFHTLYASDSVLFVKKRICERDLT